VSDDVCTLALNMGENLDTLVGKIGWSDWEMGVSLETPPRS
jgi:hypothetical protein